MEEFDDEFDDGFSDEEDYKDNDDLVNCDHSEIDVDGVCCKCSMSIGVNGLISNVTDYSDTTCNFRNSARADFEKDLAPLKSIPEDIKRWICEFSTMSRKSICRLDKRKERIFAYIILAYWKNGLKINRKEIVEELKISKNGVNEAIKAVGAISQKELPQPRDSAFILPYIVENPIDYLEEKLKILGNEEISADYEIIKQFATNLVNESNFILEEEAEPMCIAIIKFYMIHKNKDVRKLHTFFDSKTKKINDSFEIVTETYNSILQKYPNNKDKLLP